jgi:orotidine-5'-phosphate decarboxylase
MVDPSEVVIWSADLENKTELRIALSMENPLQLVKLDRYALTLMGLDTIGIIQDMGYKVFADAKIGEIPDKSLKIARLHLEQGPWMLNVFADIWSTGHMTHPDPHQVDALKRFADLCHDAGTLPCGVTVLTSKTSEVVFRQFNGRSSIDQVLVFAGILAEAGFTDVVCSPLEAAAIKAEATLRHLSLNTPGVRLGSSSSHDQARIDTPAGALASGADRLVIGRDLTNGDLAENFARIAADIAG